MTKKQQEMLKDIEAVIFDMDGTLIDSMWIWPEVDDDYLAKYNLDKPENFLENLEGKSYTEAAQLYLDEFPELDFSLEQVMQEWTDMTYEKYIHDVELKQGVYDFIKSMREQGKKIGIATSNAMELVEATLDALGIRDMFDSVRSACEVAAGKPSPDVYLLVSKDIDVAPEHCLVFEDVPMGIMAGKNAGMRVCAVDDEFSRPQERKKKEMADYYIQDFHDIKNGTYEVL